MSLYQSRYETPARVPDDELNRKLRHHWMMWKAGREECITYRSVLGRGCVCLLVAGSECELKWELINADGCASQMTTHRMLRALAIENKGSWLLWQRRIEALAIVVDVARVWC
jgi:hypothetical protein